MDDETAASVPLRAYAAVKAAVAEGFALADALAIEDLAAGPWAEAEIVWAEKLSGGGPLLDRYRAERAGAEDRLARQVEPIDEDLEAWLAFLDAYLVVTLPGPWLREHGIGVNDLSRLGRRWKERVKADPSIEKSMDRIRKRGVGPLPALHAAPARLVRSAPATKESREAPPSARAVEPAAPPERDVDVAAVYELPSFMRAPAPPLPDPPAPASATTEVSAEMMAQLASLPLPFRQSAPPDLPVTTNATAEVSAEMMAQLASLPLPFQQAPAAAPASSPHPVAAAPPDLPVTTNATAEVSAEMMAQLASLPLPFEKAPGAAAPASRRDLALPPLPDLPAEPNATQVVSAEMMAQLSALPLPFQRAPGDPPPSARPEPSVRTNATESLSPEILAQLSAAALPFASPAAASAVPLGPVSTAVVAWRARGVLYLTCVVKATFALVPEGRMSLIAPDPIACGEELDASGIGLRTAGDLAPYLALPEILLTGHAVVPPHHALEWLPVGLAVSQAGAVLVDKRLDLPVEGAAGDPPRVHITGMGPIAADWPLRKRWLDEVDGRGLTRPVQDIPDALHWEFFQTSPLDQRIESLRGDEWLLLGGMVAGWPMLRTALPAVQAAARLYRKAHAPPRAGEPVALRADTVQIDVDRRCCSILWRGRAQIADERELPSVCVAAGLAAGGHAVEWADPFLESPPESRSRGEPPL